MARQLQPNAMGGKAPGTKAAAQRWLGKADTYLTKTNKWLSANENFTGGLTAILGIYASKQELRANIVEANIQAEYEKRDILINQAAAIREQSKHAMMINEEIAKRHTKPLRTLHEISNLAGKINSSVAPVKTAMSRVESKRRLEEVYRKSIFMSGNAQRINDLYGFGQREKRIKEKEAELEAREKQLGAT